MRIKGKVSVDEFDKQTNFLNSFYNFVSENDIIEAVENKKKLPDYSIWITFDDGYKDNYMNAYPILRKYKIPATFFVTTGYINKTTLPSSDCGDAVFMSWEEIEAVVKGDISIGAHTVSHRILSQLSDVELEKEIIDSKREIEGKLGRPIYSFAYPVGKQKDYCSEKSIPILARYGFKLAVTTIGGFNNIEQIKNNYLELRRIGLSCDDTLHFFRVKLGLGSFWQI